MNFDKQLDTCGLACPLPVLKTRDALANLVPGQVLKVIATDAGTLSDMQAFANQTGNKLLSRSQLNGTCIFYMQKRQDKLLLIDSNRIRWQS